MNIKSLEKAAMADVESFIHTILPDTKQILDVALEVVGAIKTITALPEADIAAALVPENIGTQILAKIRQYLPAVLTDLKLADTEAGKSEDEVLKDGITKVQSLVPKAKSVTLQSIWQLVTDYLTNDAISLTDLQKIGQAYYEKSAVVKTQVKQ